MDSDNGEEVALDDPKRPNYWKIATITLASIIGVFLLYEIAGKPEDSGTSINNSFLGAIAAATKSTMGKVFSDEGVKRETLVETIDLKALDKPLKPKSTATPVASAVAAKKIEVQVKRPEQGAYSTAAAPASLPAASSEKYVAFSIRKTGSGNGIISDPSGRPICSLDCASYFKKIKSGLEIRLTALPDQDSVFRKWSGSCNQGQTENECLIKVEEQADAVATFDLRDAKTDEIAVNEENDLSPASPLEKIFISEFLANPTGSDAGKEFIELYNPNASAVSIENWSLKLLSLSGKKSSLAKIGSASDRTTLKAYGFFLIGLNNYSIPPEPDVKRSSSLPNAGGTIELYDNDGGLVETVEYSEAAEGISVERKSGESLFTEQTNPNPKNSN